MPLQAQNDPKISVQGTLKTANGVTVADGNYDVTFNLYNVQTGGTALWSESAAVEVVGGIYSHYLGSSTPLNPADFGSTLYLGVKVGSYELVPRTELSYAPYAFSVAAAQTVVCSGAVGDIKYSILDPTEFAKVNGNCWVPMDGRDISTSKLATHGVSSIPNAGGMFLRAQEFGSHGTFPSNNDPDRTSDSPIAVAQVDTLQSHKHGGITDKHIEQVKTVYVPNVNTNNIGSEPHTIPANGWSHDNTLNNHYLWTGGGTGDAFGMTFLGSSPLRETTDTGAAETRPKNINLYIYIRIN
ncbi:MAG: hypothetical protein H6574_10745 [Lewinellaceae bacterium]|nr:hypothetical protein [Lewinellaceae bacterium]